MRRVAAGSFAIAVVLAFACGDPLPPANDSPGKDGGTESGPTKDAAVPVADLPPEPATCPLTTCPADAGNQCDQDDCAPELSMKVDGLVSEHDLGNGEYDCAIVDDGSTVSDPVARPDQRNGVLVLSFQLKSISASGIRPIARIAIDGLEGGERFEAVVDGNRIMLCEAHDTVKPVSCTEGVTFTPPTPIQLYGLVASDEPRGAFVLRVGCDKGQSLPVTQAFATNDAVIRVGCIEERDDTCAMFVDDVVDYFQPE